MSTKSLPSGFRWRLAASVAIIECEALAAVAPHGFTSRAIDVGQNDVTADAWARLASAFDLEEPALARLRQVHGRRVVEAREACEARNGWPDADVLISNDPSVGLAVQTADCVPLLLADRRSGAVAAVHAGWRGTAAGATSAAVDAVEARYGSRPEDLVVAVGPSIGPCCYQVGEEVRDAFASKAPSTHEAWFASDAAGRWRFDLWRAHTDELRARGVPASGIHVSGLCTAHLAETFFSYRRDGNRAGRLAAVIRAAARFTA